MAKKIFSACLSASLLLIPFLTSGVYDSQTAQSYLQAHATTPWSVMALSASGIQTENTDFLKNISGSSAIDYEAPILAISSLGQDPKTFGGSDYVSKLKSYYTGGQIGDPTTLNDDVFGILALASSGLTAADDVMSGSENFLLSHQNSDGGWAYTVGGNSDSNTTASAIVALAAIGTPVSDAHIQNALAFLKTFQQSDGGFAYDAGSQSDSSSTAWVMWALSSLNIKPEAWSKNGNSPQDYLESNQAASGYFQFQNGSGEDSFSPVTTSYAVIALANKTLPIKTISASLPSINFRIEGSNNTVCNGQVSAQTALDVIKNASVSCGFTYNIQTTSYGPYLNQINTDTASGNTGWMYLVNNISPSSGAANYQLKTDDSVLWYFGDFTWQPLKLDLSASTAGSGQSVTATIQSFDGSAWSPLSGSTVYFGALSAPTDSSGQATITAPDGYYKIYAGKTGYIRSQTSTLQVGQPSNSAVSLSASFSGGQVAGTSSPPNLNPGISFTVNIPSLDFGDISAGSKINKSFTIQNNGTSGISLNVSLSGDTVFTQNLSLNGKFWQQFTATVSSGQSQSISAGLNVPSGYSDTNGPKSGQMVLWAAGNN